MFNGLVPSSTKVNRLLETCFARCSVTAVSHRVFPVIQLDTIISNVGLFCWARLGSQRHWAKVDCCAAEVMKSSAVFTRHAEIRPSFFP